MIAETMESHGYDDDFPWADGAPSPPSRPKGAPYPIAHVKCAAAGLVPYCGYDDDGPWADGAMSPQQVAKCAAE